ncbi:MAG: alpha-glucosidase C-terminal domain-containing protein [Bacteroidales bacterium]|nr:alpha-glucosidase C-terminal domain-containing protein [Bacteroidales bacterium]
MNERTRLKHYWNELYPDTGEGKLNDFLRELEPKNSPPKQAETDWYKDAIVYALYVDLFNKDFNGLSDKLDYLQDLGVNCLWLLPILDSPMRDAGFDIKKYDRIRPDLLGLTADSSREEQEAVFGNFLKEAHSRGIRVIFDIAINHSSDQHPWFLEARKSEDNPYRNYYIWSKNTSLYGKARLLFKGIEDSNWEPNGDGWNYFHRFFSFQPDLNYKNPDVLLAMSRNLLYWQTTGVDGFRADAIPYLWKEEGSNCENLPKTHTIVKFFRAILDYTKPGTLLLAEACQKPKEVVKYMGEGDECHAAYHFPLMPMMFKAIALEDGRPVKQTLSPAVTPRIPANSQWLSFLRVHDELSLELVYVSEEDRKFIHDNYCHQAEWDFRLGEGISARLSELMQRDERKIGLAYSLMLTLTGTPVVYYGDEFGKWNDEKYYAEQIKLTGKDDTRFLVRGRIDWEKLQENLKDEESFHSRVFGMISSMLNTRKDERVLGRGTTGFLLAETLSGEKTEKVLAYTRTLEDEQLLVINNLSSGPINIRNPFPDKDLMLLFPQGFSVEDENSSFRFEPFGFVWLRVI